MSTGSSRPPRFPRDDEIKSKTCAVPEIASPTAFPAMAPAHISVRPPPVWVRDRNTAEVMAEAVKIDVVTRPKSVAVPSDHLDVISEDEDADVPLYEDLGTSDRALYGLGESTDWASL